MTTTEHHIPVLHREVLTALNVKADGLYLDGTLGRAGHAKMICKSLGDNGRLVALDRDPRAIELGQQVFADDSRVLVLKGEFAEMEALLASADVNEKFDGIFLDLGVSSPQLDQAERGFSFMRDGALDMRMDPSQGESAAQWLSYVSEADLARVIFQLGEEKFSRRIARAIVETREEEPITNTLQLANLIEQVVPKQRRKGSNKNGRQKSKHPATKTFQAIRLHINGELDQIKNALPKAVKLLAEGGRLVVISFHSLEDRIVKRFMRDLSVAKLPPKNIPITDQAYKTPLKLIGRAIKPSEQEILENPRARSSVMRVAERTEVDYA